MKINATAIYIYTDVCPSLLYDRVCCCCCCWSHLVHNDPGLSPRVRQRWLNPQRQPWWAAPELASSVGWQHTHPVEAARSAGAPPTQGKPRVDLGVPENRFHTPCMHNPALREDRSWSPSGPCLPSAATGCLALRAGHLPQPPVYPSSTSPESMCWWGLACFPKKHMS